MITWFLVGEGQRVSFLDEYFYNTSVNNKINTLKSVGLKTYFYFAYNMKFRVFKQLRASISHLTTTSTKKEMFEDKVDLKRPSPWPLKGQNPTPITNTVEKIPDMGINWPKNTENQVEMPKN